MRLMFVLVVVTSALLPGCRLLSGEIACDNDRQCVPGDTCLDGSCVAPCDDIGSGRCDTDGDGVLNKDEADGEAENACAPDPRHPRCAVVDTDGDGTPDVIDSAPSDPRGRGARLHHRRQRR